MIKVKVDNIDSIYSNFSDKNDKTLGKLFVEHLETSAKSTPRKSQIEINIKSEKKLSKKEKEICEDTIRNHYKNEIKECEEELKKQRFMALCMFVAGLLILVLLELLSNITLPYTINKILEITSWVFIWEFIYMVFFHNTALKFTIVRFKKLANSIIVFE